MEIVDIRRVSFEEQNERMFYTQLEDEKEELSRRSFLKYAAVGSTGLLVPLGFHKDAEAFFWIPAIIEALAIVAVSGVVAYAFSEYDDKFADTKLSNGTNKTAKGKMRINLAKKDPDYKYINLSTLDLDEKIASRETMIARTMLSSADEQGKYEVRSRTKYSDESKKFLVT